MDPIQTKELRAHLIEAAKQRAVLVSSHAVADLDGLAARIAVLRDGELVAVDTPGELVQQTGTTKLDEAVVKLLASTPAEAMMMRKAEDLR